MGILEPYLFQGVVLPERAQLSLKFGLHFTHASTGIGGVMVVSIILNQVAAWVESEHDWDIHDLRNVVKNVVQGHLAMLGYLLGRAYDFEITRVVHTGRQIDYIFGIDIPILAKRQESIDVEEALARLRGASIGPYGVYLRRCFNDLVSSMKDADDTAFYCYRAIESLRLHCAALHGLLSASKPDQWQKFREISSCTRDTIDPIKKAAQAPRHGEPSFVADVDRAALFTRTWDIVDGYLKAVC